MKSFNSHQYPPMHLVVTKTHNPHQHPIPPKLPHLPYSQSPRHQRERERGGGITHNTLQHILLTTLLQLARKQQLIENKVRLLKIKDDIQLTHIPIILIHLLYISMNRLQCNQLIIIGIYSRDKEQTRVPPIDHFRVFVFDEVAHPGAAGEDELGDVFDDFSFFFGGEGLEPFGETDFALAREEDEVPYH